jgi:hypothetical protein
VRHSSPRQDPVSAVFVYLARDAKPPKSAEIEAFTFSKFERAVRRLETQLERLESEVQNFQKFLT